MYLNPLEPCATGWLARCGGLEEGVGGRFSFRDTPVTLGVVSLPPGTAGIVSERRIEITLAGSSAESCWGLCWGGCRFNTSSTSIRSCGSWSEWWRRRRRSSLFSFAILRRSASRLSVLSSRCSSPPGSDSRLSSVATGLDCLGCPSRGSWSSLLGLSPMGASNRNHNQPT